LSGVTPVIVYAVFALGAAGICLALPGRGRPMRRAGLVFGLAAIAGFVVFIGGRLLPHDSTAVTFGALAAAALFGAGRVVTHPKPVYSAVYFVLVVVAVACLMVLQEAEFLGIALIIVYAGAILVTYVFVIMLSQQSGASPPDTRAREPLAAVLAGFITMAAIAGQAVQPARAALTGSAPSVAQTAPLAGFGSGATGGLSASASPRTAGRGCEPIGNGNTFQVGVVMLSRYVVALELSGVLLLVAMVGAIALARKPVPRDVPMPTPPPPGQIGREVAPF
jgi:NADH-quinone oxidoreductase subunit J